MSTTHIPAEPSVIPNEPHKGGDVNERNPNASELFFHSHIYESVDGAEHDGWEGIVDDDVVELADQISTARRKLDTGLDNRLFPPNHPELIDIVKKGMESILANRPPMDEDESDRVIVTEDGNLVPFIRGIVTPEQ